MNMNIVVNIPLQDGTVRTEKVLTVEPMYKGYLKVRTDACSADPNSEDYCYIWHVTWYDEFQETH